MAETAHNVASAAHGGEAASGGMPQLDFSTFPNQIFWLVVTINENTQLWCGSMYIATRSF